MLRLFRSRKNIVSLGAKVNGPARGPQPQVVHIQHVKIRRKWFKPMNLVIACGVYYGCYLIYDRVVFGTLGKWAHDQEAQLSEKERQELDDEDLEPLFIPFPGTTKMVEPLPYRGSDPEWQAYLKISKNQKLVQSIQKNLAELTRRVVESHPMLSKKFGKDMKVRKFWLDIQYPYKPPPTFVRTGIAIDDDGISIAEMPVDSFAVLRAQRVLFPSALGLSLWSFSGALMKQNAVTFAKLFGYEPKAESAVSVQQTIDRIHQQLKKSPGKTDSPSSASVPSTKGQATGGSAADPMAPVDKRSAGSTASPETLGSGASVGGAVPNVPSAKDLYMIKTTQEHTSGPWQAFKQKMAQTWKPLKNFPPRGSLSVSGLVEIVTPRAIVTVDVYAWWDPKTEDFDPTTTILKLRTIRPKTQSALR
ncbi:Uu.00g035980.m01.CDS01 [Anthostomella pinea]|uniref:Uu.00g035980.m01.CDS01 n=1 Tax=Anthostomella pinea TaxID=933095 RepID=A0AAI8YDH3_9PEZI|nr:Uu.00g035980.m01.CDS01 [Anthostomella pinea]